MQLFLTDCAPTQPARLARIAELADRFHAVPGVQAVAGASALPFHPSQIDVLSLITIEGMPTTATPPVGQASIAAPGYFSVMEMPLISARDFTHADNAANPAVKVLSESLTRRLFPDGNATGA